MWLALANGISFFWLVDLCIKRKWYKEYNGYTQDLQCEQKRNQQMATTG